jgi:hypothetical protein
LSFQTRLVFNFIKSKNKILENKIKIGPSQNTCNIPFANDCENVNLPHTYDQDCKKNPFMTIMKIYGFFSINPIFVNDQSTQCNPRI